MRHEEYVNDSPHEGPQGITLAGYERLFETADVIIAEVAKLFPSIKKDRVGIDIFYNHIPRVHNTAYLLMEILRKKGMSVGISKIAENKEVPPVTKSLVRIKIQESKERYEGFPVLCGFVSHETDLRGLLKEEVNLGKIFFRQND